MIIEMLSNKELLTQAEQAVASYALAHPDEVQNLTTQQLATASCSSKATVVRLCHKVGVSSYQEFKTRLLEEATSRARVRELLGDEPLNASSSYEQILRTLPALYESSAEATAVRLDKRTVVSAASKIMRARLVELYGSGITQTAAELAAFKFELLDIPCSVHSGLNDHRRLGNRHAKETVAIVFSFTGVNPHAVRIASTLRADGYYVLGIGGNYAELDSNSLPLRDACSEYLELGCSRNLSALDVLMNFQSMSYVIDVLFSWMLIHDYERNEDVAARVYEKAWMPLGAGPKD